MSLKIGNHFEIDQSVFDSLMGKGYLRPFELATLRLINMIEVLKNWSKYMHCSEFLTQRGATFYLDPDDYIMYNYFPEGLLSYSETMKDPLAFLEN